jgi:GT2 family glycosyltransferase
MIKPMVSVGVVVFNTPQQTLERTLQSLKGSTVPVDIICLCNSPSQRYQDDVKEMCARLGVLCLSNQPNSGFGAGHNVIWRSVYTDWYICCNPDVVVDHQAILKLLEFAETKSDVSLLMPQVRNVDGSIQPVARQHPTPTRWIVRQLWRMFPCAFRPYEIAFDYSTTQPVEFVTGCFFMVKLDVMRKLNGFDESFFLYAEDADISKRAERHGLNWYVHSAIIIHAWSAEWKRSFSAMTMNLFSLIRYWCKHYFLVSK